MMFLSQINKQKKNVFFNVSTDNFSHKNYLQLNKFDGEGESMNECK